MVDIVDFNIVGHWEDSLLRILLKLITEKMDLRETYRYSQPSDQSFEFDTLSIVSDA